MLNEGLEVLGENKYVPNDRRYCGVFEESGLKDVKLPSTLKRIEWFAGCKKLKAICFPEGLNIWKKVVFRKQGSRA